MSSVQIKIDSSNKSFTLKHAQPTMDLSQVTVINEKVGKSFIPSVPVNYTCSKRQKAGKSFIPRFMIIHSKQAKNGKLELSHVDYLNLGKDKTSISYSQTNYCKPVKNGRSYIPRKTAKKVELLLYNTQEKQHQKVVSSLLFGKSKIPVPISTKKTSVSTFNNSTKKVNVTTRTSHRNCTICSPSLNSIKKEKKEKKENARVLRFNVIQDNQVLNPIKNDVTSSRISTPTSFKKSLIPVHNKLPYNLFKKRVSPLQPSTITLIKKDDLTPTSTSDKKSNDLICTSLKNKCTSLQKSVNKPEPSISISHNKVEVSTTTIIKPELSSISLLHKAEKDLSGVKHQSEVNDKGAPTLFGNVFKTIVRYSKDLFSKLL